MPEIKQEQLDALLKNSEDLQKLLAQSEKEKNDKIFQEQVNKAVEDALGKVAPAPQKKMVFGDQAITDAEGKEITDAEGNVVRCSMQKFMSMVRSNNPQLKTVMEVQTDAQGGYGVPVEYSNQILGALNNVAQIPAMCTNLTQGAPTVNMPAWLTDLTVYWVDEDGTKTLTKPTLQQRQLTLKKMAAIVPFTDELLDDNIINLQGQIPVLIGENMGLEIERIVLEGSTAAGDAFNGIANATGVNSTAQAGVNLDYDDIVDLVSDPNMLERYRMGARIFLNRTAMKLIMKMKDNNNLPIWNPRALRDGDEALIAGYPYTISDQITAGATTEIYFGNLKHVILGNPKKNAGINVAVSNSAVTPVTGAVTQNAFLQDETWFRFVRRISELVAIPEAFGELTGVK